jgi:hypothetical protein
MPVYPILEFPLLGKHYLDVISDSARGMKRSGDMGTDNGVTNGKSPITILSRLDPGLAVDQFLTKRTKNGAWSLHPG